MKVTSPLLDPSTDRVARPRSRAAQQLHHQFRGAKPRKLSEGQRLVSIFRASGAARWASLPPVLVQPADADAGGAIGHDARSGRFRIAVRNLPQVLHQGKEARGLRLRCHVGDTYTVPMAAP